tara:strand:- start:418 stop:522 length:105 start_codon:yes stop_codon:yes gene_type:complete
MALANLSVVVIVGMKKKKKKQQTTKIYLMEHKKL